MRLEIAPEKTNWATSRTSCPDGLLEMSAEQRQFRSALARFPTGVAVATARGAAGEAVGITINSFASVSLEPPLVSWCLKLLSPRYAVFRDARNFAVNVLAQNQIRICRHFASSSADWLSEIEECEEVVAAPLIRGCSARFLCVAEERFLAGDHAIFLGRVERYSMSEELDPLIFCNGTYVTAAGNACIKAASGA